MSSGSSFLSVSVIGHTTASSPRPHILYILQVTPGNGVQYTISKRYSEFNALHNILGPGSGPLPPKRILTTTFIPSAWVDDKLVNERTAGLGSYLSGLLTNASFANNASLKEFLTPNLSQLTTMSLEDALPSTLSRQKAQALAKELDVEPAATSLVAAAYYPDWSTKTPESIDFSKFDLIYFAFALPSSSSKLSWDANGQSLLQRLVTSARNSGKGTKVALSVGGWGGSKFFSQAVHSTNRPTFVKACVDAVNSFKLDGIDIDWEYPNSIGAGDNIHAPHDASNLLLFFKELRSALGSSKIISAAVPHLPWLGVDGTPLKDVSQYASVMTSVNIMNYDVNGASSTPGPNAPLSDACHNSRQPQANAAAALAQWKAAGFPANKLLLGLPLYGYASQSSKTTLSDFVLPGIQEAFPPEAHPHPRTPPNDDGTVRAEAGGDLSSYWGQQIPFNEILRLGALSKKSDGTYGQANGYTEGWDNCSDTPFLFNQGRNTVVTYDDTFSLADKASFARQNGMKGCFTWSLDQDDGVTLQNAIRKALGK